LEYFTAAELSRKWSVSSRMVAYYCETGKIDGAIKKGKLWLIPISANKPTDKRSAKNKVVIKDNQNLQGNLQSIDQIDADNSCAVYRANDLYKNLGLTRETLRYYEEIGLISPERNPNSQYRKFTFSDVSHLLTIDFYKKRGFTPLEIKKLKLSGKQTDSLCCLNKKIEDLQENIQVQQRELRHLNETKQFCECSKNANGKFQVKEFPLYFVLQSFDAVSSLKVYEKSVLKYLNLQQEDILSNLVRVVTFDSYGYRGSGMCIVKPAAEIVQQAGNVSLESGKCLYTVFDAENNDESIMEKMFFSCYEWAGTHHLEFKGVAYIFIRFVTLSEQAERNFYEVWLPLK